MITLRHITLGRNTQHSQETDIHAPGVIRIHNPNKRAAADPRLRPRGYWDRSGIIITFNNYTANTEHDMDS